MIKRLANETWSEEDLKPFIIGGNRNYINYLTNYKLHDTKLKKKFLGDIPLFYSRRLRANVAGTPFGEVAPDIAGEKQSFGQKIMSAFGGGSAGHATTTTY